MKKIFGILAMLSIVAVGTFVTSCNSCSKENSDVIAELDVNSIMLNDYNYIDSLYQNPHFYEMDVHFDTFVSCSNAKVDAVRTIFQVKDTCIMLNHFINGVDTLMFADYWLECNDLDINVKYGLNDVLAKLGDMRDSLNTQYVTLRRPVIKTFPEYGWWIFGKGIYAIDSETGEPVECFDNYIDSHGNGNANNEWI